MKKLGKAMYGPTAASSQGLSAGGEGRAVPFHARFDRPMLAEEGKRVWEGQSGKG